MMGVFVGGAVIPIDGAKTGEAVRTDGSSSHVFPVTIASPNIPIGDAASNRRIVTVWTFSTNADRSVSSCTIRGVAATVHKHAKVQDDTPFSGQFSNVVIASAIVPSGTELIGSNPSTDARLNLSGISGAGNGAYCAFYRLIGAGTVITDEDSEANDDVKTLGCALDIQGGDFIVGGVCANDQPTGISLSGLVQFADYLENDTYHGHGYYSAPLTRPAYPMGASISGTYECAAMAVAAFRA